MMPRANRFRHQTYPTTPVVRPRLLRLSTEDKPANITRLHEVHEIHRILLVHGTFMGDDPFGISEVLELAAENAGFLRRGLETLAQGLAEATKTMMGSVSQDVANYSAEVAARLQQLVGESIVVELPAPSWSGQNHHTARVDLAMRLFVRLTEVVHSPEQRVLLWGHSHAGNGFAILSNLLANDKNAVRRVFEAAGNQPEHWQLVRMELERSGSPHPLARSVDMATFGTPVRYGWDTDGFGSLLHVLHHREQDPRNPFRTRPLFPPHGLADTLTAKFGDWVQAFAIEGTDVSTATSVAANRELAKVLTAGLADPEHGVDTRFLQPSHIRDVCARWKTGTRCHADGHNLLVDYQPCGRRTSLGQPIEQSVLGHGVATTLDWLPRHLSLILETLDAGNPRPGN